MPQSFVHSSATGPPNSTVPSGTSSNPRTSEQGRKGLPIPTPSHVSDVTCAARSEITENGQKALGPSSQVSNSPLTSAFTQIKAHQARFLLERHKKHYSRHNKRKLDEQSPKSPSLSTSNSDEDRPSSLEPEELKRSIYCSALREQAPSSTDGQSTGVSSQQCSKKHTYRSAGEKYQCERDSLGDDSGKKFWTLGNKEVAQETIGRGTGIQCDLVVKR
jgi:hypothetical protein